MGRQGEVLMPCLTRCLSLQECTRRMQMSNAIEGLKPALVWKYFAEIAKIPRCSKHEGAIVKYVLDTAKKLGLEAKADKFGNVVVRKPASRRPGACAAASCCRATWTWCARRTRTRSTISRRIRSNSCGRGMSSWPTAPRSAPTTASPWRRTWRSWKTARSQHGPLEFLFTVDEETGLTGASNLGADFLVSKTLAQPGFGRRRGSSMSGARVARIRWRPGSSQRTRRLPALIAAELKVTGLKGGHSGLEIDKNRGNSIKIITRVLRNSLSRLGVRLSIDRRRQQAQRDPA